MALSQWFRSYGFSWRGSRSRRRRATSVRPHLESLEDRTLLSLNQFALPTQDAMPLGITAGADGALWFAESGAGQIGRISLAGKITEWSSASPSTRPEHIAAGPDGALWFTERGSNKIGRLTTDFQFSEFEIPTVGSNPQSIVSGPDNAMWFTERNADKIGKITMDGKVTEFEMPTASPRARGLQGITLGLDGAIWFTEQALGRLGRVTSHGFFTEYALPEPGDPYAIVAGADGNLWFTEQFRNRVGRMTPAGEVKLFGEPALNEAFGDITPGRDGGIWYVVNITVSAPLVRHITAVGVESDVIVDLPNGYPGIGGITVGPDDNIWFTETTANQIGQWTLNVEPALSSVATPLAESVAVHAIHVEYSSFGQVQPIDTGDLELLANPPHIAYPLGPVPITGASLVKPVAHRGLVHSATPLAVSLELVTVQPSMSHLIKLFGDPVELTEDPVVPL